MVRLDEYVVFIVIVGFCKFMVYVICLDVK